MPRPRKSSGLGAELRGDTGAAALSTLDPNTPPLTPVSKYLILVKQQLICILVHSAIP